MNIIKDTLRKMPENTQNNSKNKTEKLQNKTVEKS
jgi:hypothetical protein